MSERRVIIVRYDEIALKGKNRSHFVNRLMDNIRRKLAGPGIIRLRAPRGRVLIDVAADAAEPCRARLRQIPGIASFSIGIPIEPDPEKIAALGAGWIAPHLRDGHTLRFCVRTQRSDKSFPLTSPECNFAIGSRIMGQLRARGLVVALDDPDYALEVEIGAEETVVFDHRVSGLRGLPSGTAGDVLTLLSGGIDSPVAAFMMIRRGCRSHFIFFENRAFLGRGGYEKVLRLARVLNRFQDGGRLLVVPFGGIQAAIRDHCRPANRVILYRRMMYRIAHAVALRQRCLALVTGESLGQVASQTLENLAAVSSLSPMSVFRPLIGMDKVDITQQARRIQTFDISIEPQPDCCSVFMPPNPATRARIVDLEHDETIYPWQALMAEAIEKIEEQNPGVSDG